MRIDGKSSLNTVPELVSLIRFILQTYYALAW